MRSSSSLLLFILACSCLAGPATALQVGTPQLVSRSMHGGSSVGFCGSVALSQTGRYIAFTCMAGDIVDGDTNDRSDAFWVDRETGAVRRVSLNAANAQQINHSFLAFPSDDGQSAVFEGEGMFHPDVVSAPGIGERQIANVFLRDFSVPATLLLTRSASGEGNPGRLGALLRDAAMSRHEILFASSANYMADASTPSYFLDELFSRNWQSGRIERISARPDGGKSAFSATLGSYSSDGRFVVFLSRATDITSDNPLGLEQLFLRDRVSRTTTRLTHTWHGGEFDTSGPFPGPTYRDYPRLADGGRLVAFQAALNDEFVSDDNPGVGDVYLLDRASGVTELISRARGSEAANGTSFSFDISDDGDLVAFFTRATNILQSDAPPSIYLKERSTGAVVNVTLPFGETPNSYIPRVDLSADGSTLAFSWQVDDPALPPWPGRTQVFTVDIRRSPRVVPVPATTLTALLVTSALLAGLAGSRTRRVRA